MRNHLLILGIISVALASCGAAAGSSSPTPSAGHTSSEPAAEAQSEAQPEEPAAAADTSMRSCKDHDDCEANALCIRVTARKQGPDELVDVSAPKEGDVKQSVCMSREDLSDEQIVEACSESPDPECGL